MAARKNLTVQLPADVVDRLRATIVGLRRQGHDATIAAAAADSLTAWCARQEQQHHRGQPYPPTDRVPPGRRLTTGASTEAL